MKYLIYQHFGLASDPWPPQEATADARRVSLTVAAAVAEGGMVAIVGQRGVGKSHALWSALGGIDCSIVEPLRLDRERLHIGDIVSAIVTQLSDESPRHSAEARAGQARRMLRAARGKRRPALVIDEAHALHHHTLRALKRLRELGARGKRGALLPVILVGQSDPTARVAEVGLRTDTLTLSGLSPAEASAAVTATLGSVMTPEAVELLAGDARARNWLELQSLVDECLSAAMVAGEQQVDTARVRRVLGDTGPQARLPEAPAPGRVAAALQRQQAA